MIELKRTELESAKDNINNSSSSTRQELSSQSASTTANVSPSIVPGVNIPIATKVNSTLVRRVPRLRCATVSLGWPAARQTSLLSTGEAVKVCSSEMASTLRFFARALFIQNGTKKIHTHQSRAVGADCPRLSRRKEISVYHTLN
ncbi:hypothetical protein E2C01_029172 [Portunus trituberculatus]|uniref:Uncharacterized protein n=1 Tax=Portunus trituberculatus TaxID=210409 RepID=A0A5B7ER33_PORTR|nr:hypothetical protein [Portunus trituberculatus]